MEKFFKSLVKDKHFLVLSILLSMFIVFDVHVPEVFADMIDNPLGKVSVAGVVLWLLSMNHLVGIIAIIAGFVLIKRSGEKTGTEFERRYLPTESKKSGHLNSMNQFPVTVEEEIISKMLPISSGEYTDPSYKPVLGDNHDAACTKE